MRINVTQRDIDKGRLNDCLECPVARAVRRHLPGASVGTYSVSPKGISWSTMFLPEEAQKFR